MSIMRAVPLLLAFLPIALGIAHPHGVRPRFVQNAAVTEVPQLVTHPENNDMLHEVRRNMQRVRGLRRRAKVQAMQLSRSSRAAAPRPTTTAARRVPAGPGPPPRCLPQARPARPTPT